MNHWEALNVIRREYGNLSLLEKDLALSPITQFKRWFKEVLAIEKKDPTAMVLSTVDEKGLPDSRVVLLKGIESNAFVFYTNYQSTKAVQLNHTAYAALNFYWPEMVRQVRVRGQVKKAKKKQSDDYFSSRPLASQVSAIVSKQSKKLSERELLEKEFNNLLIEYHNKPIIRPEHWGGYLVIPEEMEFWQGRDNRLHDRILYCKKNSHWISHRLAP